MSFPRKHRLIVQPAALLAITFGALAYAAIPDAGVIHECYQRNSGQLRDAATNAASEVQVPGLPDALPAPLAIGWMFDAPAAGTYTYALDLGGTGAAFAFNPGSRTLTALYVPGGPNG